MFWFTAAMEVPVARGGVVDEIGGADAAGPLQILRDDVGPTGNVIRDVAPENAGIKIVPAPGPEPDDEGDRLPAIEIFLRGRRRSWPKARPQARKRLLTVSPTQTSRNGKAASSAPPDVLFLRAVYRTLWSCPSPRRRDIRQSGLPIGSNQFRTLKAELSLNLLS